MPSCVPAGTRTHKGCVIAHSLRFDPFQVNAVYSWASHLASRRQQQHLFRWSDMETQIKEVERARPIAKMVVKISGEKNSVRQILPHSAKPRQCSLGMTAAAAATTATSLAENRK